MADYTDSAPGMGGTAPLGAVETSFLDGEPLIKPDKLKRLHLFGIPLVSAIKDPLTGRPQVMTDPDLQEFILEAVALAELEVGNGSFSIFPRQLEERHPYDRKEQESFGFVRLRHRPVASVEQFAVQSSDGVNVWVVPNNWIDKGLLHLGQINMIPFAVAAQSGVTIPVVGPTGMGLLPSLFKFNWVPQLYTATYTVGFKDGILPRVINQLIGVIAAMEVLDMLATTYARSSSSSISLDGGSQSVSTPGGELFQVRMQFLAEKRRFLVKKIQRLFGLGFFSDNV